MNEEQLKVFLNEEQLKIEKEGYIQGINPLMGRFHHKFNMKPIPYGNKNKEIFYTSIRNELKDIKYYFWGEIKLTIILYLNESRRYETPESGDLDNYSKAINDAISGINGIIIDDTQIQTLTVQWMDTMGEEYFEIEISSHPDEFILKDVEFYEMPNGLYYPFSKKYWTVEGVKESDITALLTLCYETIKIQKPFKHKLRTSGLNKEEAYYQAQKVHPILRGFHLNRVRDFKKYKLSEWKKSEII
ncbi:RusA family crossover junction endodeoxyribonuclease [Bacillus cereus]|uniref:RusA family crossover junction endodeoxyribonuclease n=1 Tax=Bacillus cereus TaxID=1396 RepID=UPI0018CE4311|nr:RusA family crossover junction endodeoxyribonuclease [Bacillus cereus]MBG9717697.1 hypothetical protein [Bacillus cereus]